MNGAATEAEAPARAWCASVWCCYWMSPDAHPVEPWGIGVPGYRGGGAEICCACARRLAAEAPAPVPATDGTINPLPGD